MRRRTVSCGLLLALCTLPIGAQLRPVPVAVSMSAATSETGVEALRPMTPPLRDEPPGRPAPWFAPLASLLVPGSGQALLRQQRTAAYVVAEGFLVLRTMRARRDADHARDTYRSLASEVARAGYGGAVRPVGVWEYYETLEEYRASGSYNLLIGGKFTPETDLDTYNGIKWQQARETYWADPDVAPPETSAEYQRAIAFYKARAVQGSFEWSWRDHQNEQAAYIETIREANRSKQQFVSGLGLVAANHLISMVDAYINVRVRRYGGAGILGVSMNTRLAPRTDARSGDLATPAVSTEVRMSVLLPRR